MVVNTATFLADTIILIRNDLRDNVTDPIKTSRPDDCRFAMTSYPKRKAVYPLITIKDINISSSRLGMQSESDRIDMVIEVRIWAKNVAQRDELFGSVYNRMRENQFGTKSTTTNGLHDFSLLSAVNVNEEGAEGIKSKVMEIGYLFIAE